MGEDANYEFSIGVFIPFKVDHRGQIDLAAFLAGSRQASIVRFSVDARNPLSAGSEVDHTVTLR